MIFKRLTDYLDSRFQEAWELYQESFPIYEQREYHSQLNILQEENYHFDLIYDEMLFVGIVLYWQIENYIYIEHFCILPSLRNKRYGQRVLSLLEKKYQGIILEIDLPIDDIACRRKEFYKRCGFVENDIKHIHPPYHQQDKGHSLMIMSYPNLLKQDEYDLFNIYLKNRIMKNAFILKEEGKKYGS